MKMYEKKELEYKGGYLVTSDNKVVGLDNCIVCMLNKLEEDVQRAKFMHTQEMLNIPQIKLEFQRKTEHGNIMPTVEANTPELDEMVAKTEKLMDEFDKMAAADFANEYLADIMPLIMFANDEFIVSVDQPTQERLDLLCVGDPLKLTKERIVELVTEMFYD